ncbi:hypothetical protein EDD18DRAFT_1112220 [Armillaria luteobubalina]|uniref:Uncharacterized protein n=1 Tax=Armillaria luteobubalina TaxID=153913 RepID=A0AA39PF36_9AGAR|nr:hypothetical protein EDD18DRAFT_1112220 [Armillaria luteobubalina]
MAIQVIGYLLHWGLFRTLSIQLYLYYLAFPKDRKFTKYLVYGIYIIEFVQMILVTHDAFAVFGYSFGDWEALISEHYWFIIPIMIGITVSAGQSVYAYQIFILSPHSSSSFVSVIFIHDNVSLNGFVAAIIAGVYMFQAGDITEFNDQRMSISIGLMHSKTNALSPMQHVCLRKIVMVQKMMVVDRE